jgi:spermidine synthase
LLVDLARLVVAFALLVVPTAAMGATLPILTGALSDGGRHRFGPVLGRLYGWNTLGAVAGVIGAELVLVDRLGLTATAWAAGLMNLLAAAVALLVSRGAVEKARGASPEAIARLPRTLTVRRLLLCAFLSGGALMALEVVWFRFLSMFVVNSTLTASLMLAVVLTAIGAGGLLASAWLRRSHHAIRYLPAVAMMSAVTTAGSYGAFRVLAGGTWTAEWGRIVWFACALSFIPSLLSGILFTLLGEALERQLAVETRAAAWLTVANTTGGMCGPVIAAFVLLPALGMERAFFCVAALYGVVGLLAASDTLGGLRTTAGATFVVATLAAVMVVGTFPFGLMARNYFVRAEQLYTADGSQVVATREGRTETIFLMQKLWMGKPLYNRLVTNGFSMSGTHLLGKRYMRSFVYWPMLLHETPLRRALVICYGVGVTAGAVTDLTSIESLDVVEISSDVVAMSEVIYAAGEHPLHDPRVRVHIEDGRFFLQATNARFDLITGEPPPPLTPGTVNLYTREYFQLLHDRLADGGIATYWLPVASRGEYDIKAIISAFCDAFEDCTLWNETPLDWMLVGSRQAGGPVPASNFTNPWSDPIVWPHLREIGFEVPEQIGAAFLGDAAYLRGLAASTPPLTDNYPHRLRPLPTRLALTDPRSPPDRGAMDVVGEVLDPHRARQAFERSEFIRRRWPKQLAQQTLPFFDDQFILNRLLAEGANPLRRIEELHALLTKTSLRRLPLWELGSDDVQQTIAESGNDASGSVEYVLGVRALVARNYPAAAVNFAKSELRGLRNRTVRPLLAYAWCLSGDVDKARELARRVEPHDADERHFWSWLQTAYGVRTANAH